MLRPARRRRGGHTQGDAFFVAFAKASDALAAAVGGKAALEPGAIRVRMGLHTGEPLLTDEGYVGIDVHRAARIVAVGYGGQILVSQSTCDLAGMRGLRDLGHHRLRDLTAPERIYQFGDEDFPPLKSLNTTNLPVASNPLVGRETELAELTAMLTDSERLVTLTGPGGSGKTRLGLQVGAELLEASPGGVFFVPLAALSAPELVRPAISRTTGVRQLEELAGRRALLQPVRARARPRLADGGGRSDLGRRRDSAAFVPGGPWPRDLERLQREVLAFADVAFETGRQAGCSLSLEEAAAWMCALD